MPQYIYQNSKLLAPVVYFTDPVQTTLWAVWAELYAQSSQEGNKGTTT